MRKKLLWVTILLAASFALTQSLAFVSTGASNGNAPAQPPASTPLAILTSFHRMMHAPALLVPLSGTTYTVNTVADNLDNNSPTPGSLRAAIRAANLNPGADTIEFAISGAGPHTINIGGGLPVITDALTIDGYSQPGASENTLVTGNNAVLQIELKDQTLSQGTALTIGASDCVVQGLVIHGFNVAVSLDGSRTNAGASRNILRGNFIGTNVAGTAVSADYSFSVAGNLNGGVLISAGGFKPDGTAGTANDNVIGGTSPSARNVISGNGSFGINLSNGIATATATRNLIQGNYIGTNAAGAAALGNGSGVFLNTNGNTVGGTFAGARNVISGNNYNSLTSSGIAACCGANDNLIQGNYIGTDATGTFAVPNAVHGIILNNNANNNTVGGTTPEARNIISGNVVVGVAIGNSGNKVQGNYIGTDVTGTQALGNGYSGVHVEQAANALIGGTEPGAGNVISANGLGGVYIASNNTIVQGNFIGTKADGASALGNLNFGVSVGGDGNLIGGRASGAGNRIAFSIIERTIDYGSGVVVTSGSATVVGNSIYSNEGLGIDVGRDWLTANDPCDGDGAANGLQNYPVLSSASSGGGATTVQGTLDSNPSTVYTLDFYANDSCAAYGFGEGRTYLGSANVTTGAACGGSFTATLPFVVPAGQILTATATDPAGNTSEFSACRVVTASNRPPDAVDDAAATNEDTPVSVGVLANDTDPDGDALTISSFTQGLNGTVTSGGGGALVYTPNANFNGSDSFTYRITDGNGGTDTATVTVTVNPVNDPPDAVDDAASTNEDTAVNINVRANDTGGDCSAVNVTSVTQGAHGSVIINPDGTLRYTPNANFNGADSFTYSIGCAAAGSDTANVSVTVNASNDAPVANNESYAVNEDSGLSVNAAAGVLANDTDAEGDALTAVLVSGPSHGSLTLNADGSFNYTPAADFYGADSFTYQAHDGVVGSNIAVVTINVGAVNDAPDARDDAATTPEDVAVNVNVLGNDTDADGDALSVEGVTQAVHGAVSINADGTVKYAPNANYNGADAFTYTVNDGHGRTDTATVAVTVTPVNDAPVAVGDSYSTNEDASLNVPVPGVLGNDSDPEGNTLAALLVSGPSHGSLGWNANGSFSYTPASNYNGGDSFTYRASDGSLSSNVATVNISINPVNDPPSAVNDSYSTNQGTTLNVAAPGVLGNDADTDGVALSAVLVNGTANGALTLNADGSFSYTPAANFAGTDSFTYQASDGAALSNTATVSITVVAVAPRWLMTGSLNTGRAGHTATLLLNGKVLVAGGSSSSGTLFNSAELYDPATGTWTLTGNIIEGRINHTATLLPDGRVLVVGGDTNAGRSAHAELYNPATGQWSSTGSLNTGRINHTATLLSNGKVLVAGGFGFSGLVTRAELYDPATGTWSNTGNLNAGRFAHTAVLLRDGSVLVAGGTDNNNILDSAELYNPATGTWSVTGSLSVRRDATEAVLLPNGKVLIAGGNSQSTFGLFVTNTAELYDPATGRWTRTGDLITRRLSHTTTRLRNGKALVAGGSDGSAHLNSSELYDPATGRWSVTNLLNVARRAHTATLLPDGRVLSAGGAPGAISSSELYGVADTSCSFTLTPASRNLGAGGGSGSVTVTTNGGCAWSAISNSSFINISAGAVGNGNGTVSFTVSANTGPARTGTLTVAGQTFTVTQDTGCTYTIAPTGQSFDAGGGSGNVSLTTASGCAWTAVSNAGWLAITSGAGGSGNATVRYSVAANSSTAARTGTLTIAGRAFTVTQSGFSNPTWTTTGGLNTGRVGHTATLLPNGKVLVAGGSNNSGFLNSAELYDPATGRWSRTGNLITARVGHTATLLPNGKVLVAGGSNGTNIFGLNSAEIFDPATERWSATGNLITARTGQTATLLSNGKVLVAGGVAGLGSTNTAELYDPATGRWSATRNLAAARAQHTATLLSNGKVLVAGGVNSSSTLNSAELYDPATGTWAATGNLSTRRLGHTATLLSNGRVLVAGGMTPVGLGASASNGAELYNPATGTWVVTADLNVARVGHTATLMPNGVVLAAGGRSSTSSGLRSSELYSSLLNGSWSATGNLITGRSGHTATLLPNGRVLAAGGVDAAGNVLNSAELHGPLAAPSGGSFMVTQLNNTSGSGWSNSGGGFALTGNVLQQETATGSAGSLQVAGGFWH